jgi:hypothetical protein
MLVGRSLGPLRRGGVISMNVSVVMVVFMDDMMDLGGLLREGP